jgi:hypothetical protein
MTLVNFEFESLPPVEGMDRIYAEYSKTFGRTPDAFMAQVVEQTKEDLFIWWAAHRERIREALVLADPGPEARERLIREQLERSVAVGVDVSEPLDRIRRCTLGCGELGQCKANAHGVPSECPARNPGVVGRVEGKAE